LPLDDAAFDVSGEIFNGTAADVVEVITSFGSLPTAFVICLLTAIWAVRRRRVIEAATLPVAMLITWLAVAVAKDTEDRARPLDPHVATEGMAYPSGHAAYAVAYIACAVVLVRAGHGLALRLGAITIAIGVAALIALSRVYLRAHYLSDVVGGAALGVAVFALCGLIALVVAHVRDNESS
jgi:undecaprenyl-diphosphatase